MMTESLHGSSGVLYSLSSADQSAVTRNYPYQNFLHSGVTQTHTSVTLSAFSAAWSTKIACCQRSWKKSDSRLPRKEWVRHSLTFRVPLASYGAVALWRGSKEVWRQLCITRGVGPRQVCGPSLHSWTGKGRTVLRYPCIAEAPQTLQRRAHPVPKSILTSFLPIFFFSTLQIGEHVVFFRPCKS